MIRFILLISLLLAAAPAFAQSALTLEEALATAEAQNYVLQQARNSAEIAANNVTWGNAGLLPRVSVSGNYDRTVANTKQVFASGDSQERTGALTVRQGLGGSVGWTVFDGLGVYATYDRLTLEAAQAALEVDRTAEGLRADVTIAYFSIVQQQQQVRVFEEAVAISDERLRIAEARLDLGSASEFEVRQARADRNADRAALLRQQNALRTAKATFNQLLARPPSTDFVAADTILLDRALTLAALEAQALDGNRALQVAAQDITIAEFERKEIDAERFPTVNLNLGYSYANLEAGAGFLESNRSYAFDYGASLAWTVFDGFDRRRRAENAAVRIRNAELAQENIRTLLATELASLFATFQNDLALIALEAENLTFARQNVDLALERFRLGTITSVELRETQETLIQARSRLLAAQFDAKRNETELLARTGTF